MRILLVSHFYATHRGGIETAACRLAEALANAGGVSIDWMASDCDAAPDALPEQVRCMPAASWNGIERGTGVPYPLWSPAALRRLSDAAAGCDIVHVHDSRFAPGLVAARAARQAGKPLVVTQHGGYIAYESAALRAAQHALHRGLAKRVLSGADQAVFVSPAVKAYFASFCDFRVPPLDVPNGVDERMFAFADAAQGAELRRAAGRDPRRPLCLFVGRFVRPKGVELVLSLARRLREADWILAGDGPLRPEDAGLPNAAVLRGRSGADIAALYRMADLLVLPSRGEGFPLVVQEAMACGTPALVSKETALGSPAAAPHLFIEDVFGADAESAWARRVGALLRDADALRAMRPEVAEAARTHWSWPAAASAYLALFRGLVARRAGVSFAS